MKKKVIKFKKAMTIGTIEKLLSVIRSTWPSDKCSPGLVFSKLKDGQYYGSIARYANFADQKQVIFNAKADTFEEVVRRLGRAIVDKQTEVADLRSML